MFVLHYLILAVWLWPATVVCLKQHPESLRPNRVRQDYRVDGKNIPDVTFDVGESYAGLLPIDDSVNEEQSLYFWYFISNNSLSSNEILIWLNGGPGASSLEGLLQENGPFQWQFGTFQPVQNFWSWVNLTNVVWVEQPVGTGFSQGVASAKTEGDVAQQFLGFWRNFVDLFDLHGHKIYLAGESYAGVFIPYIADAMFSINDTSNFNLQSTLLFDPVLNVDEVSRHMPALDFAKEWIGLLGLNESFIDNIERQDRGCGYTKFLRDHLKYPPQAKLPPAPTQNSIDPTKGCAIWDRILDAATLVNPCFNIYQITTACPLLWDVLGFPGTNHYLPAGAQVYFNRPDVKHAINAPNVKWSSASPKKLYNTSSGYSPENDNGIDTGVAVLPRVIDRSKRTVIAHSNLGYALLRVGTLLTIQNMTWGGIQGFQAPPKSDFFVPYRDPGPLATVAGAGTFGKVHHERSLTYVAVNGAGHMVPQYAPSAAFRILEYLLERTDTLSK